jgi:hypothetical protein
MAVKNLRIKKPGIYADVPMSSYISDPAPKPSLSAGIIHTLTTRSAAHAKIEHPRLTKREDDATARSDLGTAAHGRLLGGAKAIIVVKADDWRTKVAREMRDGARAEGCIPLLEKDAEAVEGMALAATAALEAAGMPLSSARAEHTMLWKDDGVWCRGRPDLMYATDFVDFKTAKNADPFTWIKQAMIPGGYHIQASHYLRGNVCLGEPKRSFIFLACELDPPHACSFIGVSHSLEELAERQRRLGFEMWQRSIKSDVWPAYAPGVHWAEAPAYLEWEFEARTQGAA